MGGRKVHRLTALQVRRATEPGLYPDGAGLYLQVAAGGSKSWLYRFMLDKRPRMMGLGSLLTTSLAEARAKALQARKLAADGVDPIDAKHASRAAARTARAKSVTFADCATAYLAAHRLGWRSVKHAKQWDATLAEFAMPTLGTLPVQAIDTAIILRVLEPIWKDKTTTASRVRNRIELVLDWAKARGYRDGANPAAWRGHLDKLLSKPSKVKRKEHHPAMDYAEVPAFIAELRQRHDTGARALEFLILTAARSGEVRGATAAEFDRNAALWTIPAMRMKAGKEHRVPLPPAALALIDDAIAFTAINSMSNLLSKMRPGVTVHGFRSAFRDFAAECTNFPNHVVEQALAHSIGNAVEAAYRRTDLLEKRRELMTAWANFCGGV
jgi:integrase